MNTQLTPFNAAARIALVGHVVMARLILDAAIVTDIVLTHAPASAGEPTMDLAELQALDRDLHDCIDELARFDACTPAQHAGYEAEVLEFTRQHAHA